MFGLAREVGVEPNAEDETLGDWISQFDDGVMFHEIIRAEVSLRETLEARNRELEEQWGDLRGELEKLRAKRQAAEEEAALVRLKQGEAEKMVLELSRSLNELAERNAQLDSMWRENASKFTSELQRLEKERLEAEKAKRTLNQRNRKLREKLSRVKDLHHVQQQQTHPSELPDPEVEKLRQLNSLFASRIDQIRNENKALKLELDKAVHGRVEAEVFAQVDTWEKESLGFNLQRTREELEAERARASYLEGELVRLRQLLVSAKEMTRTSMESSSAAELKLFEVRMEAERLEQERKEAILQAARATESMADAMREREMMFTKLWNLCWRSGDETAWTLRVSLVSGISSSGNSLIAKYLALNGSSRQKSCWNQRWSRMRMERCGIQTPFSELPMNSMRAFERKTKLLINYISLLLFCPVGCSGLMGRNIPRIGSPLVSSLPSPSSSPGSK